MRFGAHLPLIDFDGLGWPRGLSGYVDTARRLGYMAVSANDHLVFSRPWLDGIVALSSVVGASGELRLATTVSLPVGLGIRRHWKNGWVTDAAAQPAAGSAPGNEAPRSWVAHWGHVARIGPAAGQRSAAMAALACVA